MGEANDERTVLKMKEDKLERVEVPLPNGCSLYYKKNSVGGRTYWSDEIGGGVVVWDTCLVDESTILSAIVHEQMLSRHERMENYRKTEDKLEAIKSLIYNSVSGSQEISDFGIEVLKLIHKGPTTEQLIDDIMPDKIKEKDDSCTLQP